MVSPLFSLSWLATSLIPWLHSLFSPRKAAQRWCPWRNAWSWCLGRKTSHGDWGRENLWSNRELLPALGDFFPNSNFSRVPSSPIVKQWIPILHHSTWLTFVVPLHYVGQNIALVNRTWFLHRRFSSGQYRTIRIGPSKKYYWRMIFLQKLSIFGFLSKFILLWHIFADEVKMARRKNSIPIRNRIYKWFSLLPQIASSELAGVQLLWNWQISFSLVWRTCCGFFLQMWSKKTHEFPVDFPFNILSIFLPYGCQCSSVRVCGLSRPSVRAIFPAGGWWCSWCPLCEVLFFEVVCGGSGLPAPLRCRGPVLALSSAWWYCVAEVAVFLVDLCTVGDWQLTQAGCFSSTRTLVWCVMCERESVDFSSRNPPRAGWIFRMAPPQVALWERLPLKELEAECSRCRGPETLPWLITYTIGDSTWLKDHLWVDLWFSPSFLEGGGLMIRHVRFDNWWVVELFFWGYICYPGLWTHVGNPYQPVAKPPPLRKKVDFGAVAATLWQFQQPEMFAATPMAWNTLIYIIYI